MSKIQFVCKLNKIFKFQIVNFHQKINTEFIIRFFNIILIIKIL